MATSNSEAPERETPSPAQTLRSFLCLNRAAVLCTNSASQSGFPFGSATPYDCDSKGRLIVFISNIAEHYRNLKADSRACLFVADPYSDEDPQPYARAAALGEFQQVPQEEREEVLHAYFNRFPESSSRSIAHTFVLYRCSPQRIRWIGGFGDIRWVRGEDYYSSSHDAVAYAGREIISHMNSDHQDALAELVNHFHQVTSSAAHCRMVSVSSEGFEVQVRGEQGRRRFFIPFSETQQSPQSVRDQMIHLLKQCRNA